MTMWDFANMHPTEFFCCVMFVCIMADGVADAAASAFKAYLADKRGVKNDESV